MAQKHASQQVPDAGQEEMNNPSQRKQKKSLARLIRRRMLVAVILLVFALLFNFLVDLYVSDRQYNLGEQKAALQGEQSGILIAMLNQETGLRGYILTKSPAFLAPFNSGRPEYLLSVQQLKDQAQGVQANDFSRTFTLLAQVEARANAWYRTYAEVQIKRMQAGNLTVARSIGIVSVGRGLFDQFRTSMNQLQQAINDDISTIQLRVQAFNRFVFLLAILLSAIALFILGYTFLTFVKVLLGDLNILKAATTQQGSGDLAVRVQELTYQELNTLGQTFNRVAEELQQRQTALQLQRNRLETANSALEEANRARSEFFSTMSHELRTPLASMIGFSQMLLDDAQEADWNQQQQHDLARILKNGQHLLSLINDVLDLSKIEAGRMVVSYSQVDVRELLTSVVEEIQSMALAKHLILSVEVEEGIDSLESNPLKLRQVLINLVSNAIKFTEQGEVTISARRVISSDQLGDQIALAVKDSGMGIPADVQKHIFEAFYQADGSYTRKVGGTGLGLSIVRQLTTLLGGTITVESAPGQGSTFTVMLPIKSAQLSIGQDLPRLHPGQQQDVPTTSLSSQGLTPELPHASFAVSARQAAGDGRPNLILAIDDNSDAISLIRAALKGTPYGVVGVQDPLQAMELVQALHPCAIMLDVMMPDVNGWQLLNQLKENPTTASIPVVMVTVLTEPTTGYVLGADAYLIKPFETTVLLDTLEHLLASQKSPPQAGEREAQRV